MQNSEKANILVEVLPYVNRFRKHVVVIKYGGHAMTSPELQHKVLEDVHLMKSVGMYPIIVHGGGPMISEMLQRLDIPTRTVNGLRVTDAQTMRVVEMVLTGQVNPDLVSELNVIGAKSVGLSGKDANLIRVKKMEAEEDLGFVGEVTHINTRMLINLLKDDFIPVISSVGVDEEGQRYNINADYVASAVAKSLSADKLILLTDTAGVYRDKDDPSSFISRLSIAEAKQLETDGIIAGGMIPKVNCAIDAIEGGVNRVHILDGETEHAMLLELFFDRGVGTMFVKERKED